MQNGGESLFKPMCCDPGGKHPVARCDIHTAEKQDEYLVNQTADEAAGSHTEMCKDPHGNSIKSDHNGMCGCANDLRGDSMEQRVGSEQKGDDSRQLQSRGSLLGLKTQTVARWSF